MGDNWRYTQITLSCIVKQTKHTRFSYQMIENIKLYSCALSNKRINLYSNGYPPKYILSSKLHFCGNVLRGKYNILILMLLKIAIKNSYLAKYYSVCTIKIYTNDNMAICRYLPIMNALVLS